MHVKIQAASRSLFGKNFFLFREFEAQSENNLSHGIHAAAHAALDAVDGQRGVTVSGDDIAGHIEQLVATLAGTLSAGDHVLIMSNGGFGGIHQKLLERLAKK